MINSKNLGFVAAIIVAILVTFFITKYVGSGNCTKTKIRKIERSPEYAPHYIYRLPTKVLPINYELKIQPFMGKDQFFSDNSVKILVNCNESTNVIELNSEDLEIQNERIAIHHIRSNKNNQKLRITKLDKQNQLLIIQLDQNLIKNENYSIFIPFKAKLKSNLNGFYLNKYTEPDSKETRYLLVTHFEPYYARKAFPCFDEPSFKAYFNIEITHWSNMTAISNMPNISQTQIDSDWTLTKFDQTVKMSSYLVAFAVGDFEFKTNNENKPTFRIVTRRAELKGTNSALDFGPKVLKYFENYFGIEFPLTKIDNLACPDFEMGAMENWGLITYREVYLTSEEKKASLTDLYDSFRVISHELSHQWFGNLVTPKWWSDIWLNEGFASFMESVGLDAIRPEFLTWQSFVLKNNIKVLKLDSLTSSHPVSLRDEDITDVNQLFDLISYEKGSAILRMLNYTIGEVAFREGIHNYLVAFKYSNSERTDLWRHLQQTNDKYNEKDPLKNINIKKFMDSWVFEEGYPLVTIKRDYKNKKVRFSQKRFLSNSDQKHEKLLKTQYEVPITYTTKSESNFNPEIIKLWLNKKSDSSYEIKEMNISNDDWLIANLQEIGYYRVNYDEKNWYLLIDQLNTDPQKIHPINRVQLLDDLFNLAENGVVSYKLPLKALDYLKIETDPYPLSALENFVNYIEKMLFHTQHYGIWMEFIRNLITPAYQRFELKEVENQTYFDSMMQKTITKIACKYNLDSCVANSKKLFNQFMENRKKDNKSENPIPINLRPEIYCTGIRYGNQKEWWFIYRSYLDEENPVEKAFFLYSLACSTETWIIDLLLEMIISSNSGIGWQELKKISEKVIDNSYGKQTALNYLQRNSIKIWNYDKSKFENIFGKFEFMNTEDELDLLKKIYYSVNRGGREDKYYLQIIEKTNNNINWMKKYQKDFVRFLTEHKSKI